MIQLKTETILPSELSLRNPNRFLMEGWIFGDERLLRMEVVAGENTFPASYIGRIRTDVAKLFCNSPENMWSLFSGFQVPVYLYPVPETKEVQIYLRAQFANNDVYEKCIGHVLITPWKETQTPVVVPQGLDPERLAVIAMATYNPDRTGLQRQIESIRNQDYRDWICIVCDDASTKESLEIIRSVINDDRRFILLENCENVGAYRNFERCLELVPSQAVYVAMSDQDDYWYPDKLTRTIARLTGSTQLAFCDMRIVGENGDLVSTTFWRNRKNYYLKKDLDLLTLANTVSGTATVFRAELLKKALPFPELGGNLHHDKWVAIMAAASGGIAYLDEPLYDYVQHSGNVIGFCDFGRRSILSDLKSYPAYQVYRSERRKAPYFLRWRPFLEMLPEFAREMSEFYYLHARQIETFADAAECRGFDGESLSLVKKVRSSFGLIRMTFKIRIEKATTNNLEVRLLAGRFVNRVLKLILPWACLPLWRRFCSGHTGFGAEGEKSENL